MDNSNQMPQDDQQIVQQQPQNSQSPVQPTGSMQKEAGPVVSEQPNKPVLPEEGANDTASYTMEASDPSETMPILDEEVKEAGVEFSVNSEVVPLDESHAQAGIAPAKESVPVLQPQTGTQYIQNAPFTQQEATEILKTTSTSDTKHWIAVLLLMLFKKA